MFNAIVKWLVLSNQITVALFAFDQKFGAHVLLVGLFIFPFQLDAALAEHFCFFAIVI